MPETETRPGEITLERPPPLVATSARSLPAPVVCANCGQTLAGPFCSNCGQHIADYHRSVWRFVLDFLDNAICWDNKLFRTLQPLFRQPGFLTREFMLGRRVRYVHPLRLFLFVSAVCLTLLQYGHNNAIVIEPGNKSPGSKQGLNVNFGNPSKVAAAPAAPPAATPSSTPAADGSVATANDREDDGDNSSGRAIKHAVAEKLAAVGKSLDNHPSDSDDALDKAIESKIRSAGGMERFSRSITDGVEHRLSWVALGLLPVFALGLRSLYWRNDSFYFEHLIFSLHYHTFLFLFWTGYVAAQALVSWLPFQGLLAILVRLGLLGPPAYLYVALRRMYGDAPGRTAGKVMILGSMHLLAIVIGVAAVGAAAFFSAK